MKRFGFLSLSVITCFLLMFTSCLDSNGNRQQGSCYAVVGTNSSYNTVLYTSVLGALSPKNNMIDFTSGHCYAIAFEVDYDEQSTGAATTGLQASILNYEEVPMMDSPSMEIRTELQPTDKTLVIGKDGEVGIVDMVKNHFFIKVTSKQVDKETIHYSLYYHPDSISTGNNNERIYNLYLMGEAEKGGEGTKAVYEAVACRVDSFWDWAANKESDNDLVYVRLKYIKAIDKAGKIEWGETKMVSIANDKKKS